MKKGLVIIGLIGVISISAFGQKTKKTNQNPNSQAGSEAATTNNTSQAATKEQSEQMKVRDKNSWFNAKVYAEIAVSYLTNSANGFEDDNTFRLLKQYTQDAHGLLICHETGANPCNNSGAAQNVRNGGIEAVRNNLNNAKNDLNRNAFSSSEKTAVIAKLTRAIELADTYIAAHTTPPSEKGKGESSNASSNTPQIDESTKTKNGQNPIANGNKTSSLSQGTFSPDVAPKKTADAKSKTTNSSSKTDGLIIDTTEESVKKNTATKQTSNLGGDDDPEKTQRSSKAAKNKSDPKQNTGFMDYTDDAVKAAPKNTSKTNSLGGEDDPEKTQRSSKTTKSKAKTTFPIKQTDTNFQTTSEDLQSVKSAKTSNTQRSTKNTNSKVKNAKTTNWEMTDQELDVKAKTTLPKAKTKAKATNSNTSKKPKVNGVYEEDEQKAPTKKKP